MAGPYRTRGTVVDPVQTTVRIERATRNRLRSVAAQAGISSSALIELMVEHTDWTAAGMPSWLPVRDEGMPIYDD